VTKSVAGTPAATQLSCCIHEHRGTTVE